MNKLSGILNIGFSVISKLFDERPKIVEHTRISDKTIKNFGEYTRQQKLYESNFIKKNINIRKFFEDEEEEELKLDLNKIDKEELKKFYKYYIDN